MDPRLTAAVEASHAWYRDVFDVHGIANHESEGLWCADGAPPRWHSAAKTRRPDVPVDLAVAAVRRFEDCSVADSFGDLDLDRVGFERLIQARWLFREPTPSPATDLAPGWAVVSDPVEMARWNARHDTSDVLLPALLEHPRFTVVARRAADRPVAGGVLHVAGEVVELSNTWSTPDTYADLAALLACAEALHPGRPVVGYARGDDLDRSVALGFVPLGPQVVWRRHGRTRIGGRG